MEKEGGGVWIDGREAGGFPLFLVGSTSFLFFDCGAGAALFGGVGNAGYAFVTIVFGIDVVC